ncbi:uncharacterized protein LOC141896585 isoform X1 [Acropora palmata]|uniref:uncharacterized protein LOC141896585 isoform X1 n=1 Tax=Acropora palmata TaxID=6131 RepID=UPI003DA08D74
MYHTFKMADLHPHWKTEKGGKSKLRWRNPSNFHKIGNKEKGHAFVEKRKRQALKEYRKLLRKTRNEHFSNQAADNSENSLDKPALVAERAPPGQQDKPNFKKGSRRYSQGARNFQQPQKPVSRFSAAERKFKEKKLEKERQIKERESTIQKHREELQEKVKKRRETFERLNRRTRKGQPVMADRIEFLLEKIQSQT